MAPKPLRTYVVETSKYGEFPLDMLRYDGALPYGEENAKLIDRLNSEVDEKKDLPKRVRVTLATSDRGSPHVGRWESFSCKVVECSDPTILLSRSTSHPDELRQRTARMIANAVVRLRGHVAMASTVYDVLSEAVEVSGQDVAHRQRAIGMLIAMSRVLDMKTLPGFIDGEDVEALKGAVVLMQDVLSDEDPTDVCLGDRATIVIDKIMQIVKMFR
jgi:hypothetical protein